MRGHGDPYCARLPVTRRKKARIRRAWKRHRRGPVCSARNAIATQEDPSISVKWYRLSKKRMREEAAGLWDEDTGERVPGDA